MASLLFSSRGRYGPQLASDRARNGLFATLTSPHGPSRRLHASSLRASSGPAFTYKVAAAFSGKSNVFDKHRHHYRLDSATGSETWADPTPPPKNRRIPSGQDAFFASAVGAPTPPPRAGPNRDAEGEDPQGGARAVALGVADGVGGYADSGIDSAAFSHSLCAYMKDAAAHFPEVSHGAGAGARLRPLELLRRGYERVCRDAGVVGGGSTACVAVAEPDGTLEVAK